MKTSVIRRLESLEKEHRIFKQNEKSSLDDARICLWIIVLAYYVGDLKPEHDDPSNAHNRALKYPPNFCLDPESEDHRIDHFKRTYDAYRRFFAARGVVGDAPLRVYFDTFVTAVNELPAQWSSWLRSNLQNCGDLKIPSGSNIPRQLSCDHFLLLQEPLREALESAGSAVIDDGRLIHWRVADDGRSIIGEWPM